MHKPFEPSEKSGSANSDDEIRRLKIIIAQNDRLIHKYERQIANYEKTIETIYSSYSWILTKPIRQTIDCIVRQIHSVYGLTNIFYIVLSKLNRTLFNINPRIVLFLNSVLNVALLRDRNTNICSKQRYSVLSDCNGTTVYDSIKVSVVIPTKNAGDDLRPLLKMINNQLGFKEIEIILVDSGSTDSTVAIGREHGAKIVEIPSASFTHSYSRNIGAEHASGDYILFTVQDSLIPSDNFLVNLFFVLKNHNVVAVSCAEFPRKSADLFYKICCRNHYKFLGVDKGDRIFSVPDVQNFETLRKNGQLSDIACFINRDFFLKYRYRYDYAEDLDLGVRLIKDGHKIAFLSSLKMIHSHNRPAFYYLKRGYVDQIFLTRSFPDYPLHEISPDRLFQDIAITFHVVCRLIIIISTETPIDVLAHKPQSIFGTMLAQAISDIYAADMYEIGDYSSNELNEFVGKLYRHLRIVKESKYISDSHMTNALTGAIGFIYDFIIATDLVICEATRLEICDSIMKYFALLCGVSIATAQLSDPDRTTEILKAIDMNMSAGV
jgi:glycosyltransferase involved in cell wall biosynthesis